MRTNTSQPSRIIVAPLFILGLAAAWPFLLPPQAVAQQGQNIPANGIPTNLTPQQKYLRDVFIYKKLGLVDELEKQGKRVQARAILEELATLDPNPYSADVHGLLGLACYKLGNNPEAIKHYEISLQYEKGKKLDGYWNIALAYMTMSDYDQATIWCKKLLSKNPPTELRRQAERFLNEAGEEKTIQQDALQHGVAGTEAGGDYLSFLQSTKEANRWPLAKMPIKVFIEDDRHVPGFRKEFVTIFLSCLETWTRASGNRLTFQLVDALPKADMHVIYTANVDDIARKPGLAPLEQGLATIATCGYDGPYGAIDQAKIQLLVHKPSSDKGLTDDEMKGVSLHEIGHALGLSGHSPNDADIMHFMMSFRQLPALTKRDKQTIARIYQDTPSVSQTASSTYQPSNMAISGQMTPPQQPQFQPQNQQQNQPQFQPQTQDYQPQQFQQQQ